MKRECADIALGAAIDGAGCAVWLACAAVATHPDVASVVCPLLTLLGCWVVSMVWLWRWEPWR